MKYLYAESHKYLLHKYHNTPVPYPTMQQFVTEMCAYLLQNAA